MGLHHHTVMLNIVSLNGINVIDSTRRRDRSPQTLDHVSAIASFSRNKNVETSVPSSALIPTESTYSEKYGDSLDRFIAVWEEDDDQMTDGALVVMQTNLHSRKGGRYEPKTYEIVVGLVRGDETLVLGASVLTISGPENGMEYDIPIYPIDIENSRKHAMLHGRGDNNQDQSLIDFLFDNSEAVHFMSDIGRSYALDKDSSIRIQVSVLKSEEFYEDHGQAHSVRSYQSNQTGSFSANQSYGVDQSYELGGERSSVSTMSHTLAPHSVARYDESYDVNGQSTFHESLVSRHRSVVSNSDNRRNEGHNNIPIESYDNRETIDSYTEHTSDNRRNMEGRRNSAARRNSDAMINTFDDYTEDRENVGDQLSNGNGQTDDDADFNSYENHGKPLNGSLTVNSQDIDPNSAQWQSNTKLSKTASFISMKAKKNPKKKPRKKTRKKQRDRRSKSPSRKDEINDIAHLSTTESTAVSDEAGHEDDVPVVKAGVQGTKTSLEHIFSAFGGCSSMGDMLETRQETSPFAVNKKTRSPAGELTKDTTDKSSIYFKLLPAAFGGEGIFNLATPVVTTVLSEENYTEVAENEAATKIKFKTDRRKKKERLRNDYTAETECTETGTTVEGSGSASQTLDSDSGDSSMSNEGSTESSKDFKKNKKKNKIKKKKSSASYSSSRDNDTATHSTGGDSDYASEYTRTISRNRKKN